MGVITLWPLLEDAKKLLHLNDLRGQVLAIDLSIWIVEANQMMSKSIIKPYLRHIFFRVSHLLKLDILPVVVIEGKPPDLKQNIMKMRLGHSINSKPISRARFNAIQMECCEMLDYMGVPHVRASGEAEAMCAYLNYQQVVKACITNDGDAFLYGASTVYRNFTTNKEPHVLAYQSNELKEKFLLSRENLIGFAILCGCDYLPKGVPGCGQKLIAELIREIKEVSILESFKKWHNANYDLKTLLMGKYEQNVCLKAQLCEGFPFDDIVNEFLVNTNKMPNRKIEWCSPNVLKFISFAKDNLEWNIDYALNKIITLLSHYELTKLTEINHIGRQLHPNKIIKSVIRNGVKSYEMEWKKLDGDNLLSNQFYTTYEDKDLIKKNFNSIVKDFEDAIILKKKTKDRPRRKNIPKENVNDVDSIISMLATVNLKPIENVPSILIDSKSQALNKRRSRSLGCTNRNYEKYDRSNLNTNKISSNEIESIQYMQKMSPNLLTPLFLNADLLNEIKTPCISKQNHLSHYNFKSLDDSEVGNFDLDSSILHFTPVFSTKKEISKVQETFDKKKIDDYYSLPLIERLKLKNKSQ